MTGFAAADFPRVRNADLGRFALDRLIRMLGALDDGIEVTIRLGSCSDSDETAPHPVWNFWKQD